jgi:hypothetical protein
MLKRRERESPTPEEKADADSGKFTEQKTNARLLAREQKEQRRDSRDKNADSKISWDRWYASVSKLCEPLLTDAVEKHGNPGGANSIQISIWRDHHIAVKLVKGLNSEFDAATLEAYRSEYGSGISHRFKTHEGQFLRRQQTRFD